MEIRDSERNVPAGFIQRSPENDHSYARNVELFCRLGSNQGCEELPVVGRQSDSSWLCDPTDFERGSGNRTPTTERAPLSVTYEYGLHLGKSAATEGTGRSKTTTSLLRPRPRLGGAPAAGRSAAMATTTMKPLGTVRPTQANRQLPVSRQQRPTPRAGSAVVSARTTRSASATVSARGPRSNTQEVRPPAVPSLAFSTTVRSSTPQRRAQPAATAATMKTPRGSRGLLSTPDRQSFRKTLAPPPGSASKVRPPTTPHRPAMRSQTPQSTVRRQAAAPAQSSMTSPCPPAPPPRTPTRTPMQNRARKTMTLQELLKTPQMKCDGVEGDWLTGERRPDQRPSASVPRMSTAKRTDSSSISSPVFADITSPFLRGNLLLMMSPRVATVKTPPIERKSSGSPTEKNNNDDEEPSPQQSANNSTPSTAASPPAAPMNTSALNDPFNEIANEPFHDDSAAQGSTVMAENKSKKADEQSEEGKKEPHAPEEPPQEGKVMKDAVPAECTTTAQRSRKVESAPLPPPMHPPPAKACGGCCVTM